MKLFKNADKRIVSSGLAIALGAVVIYCVIANLGAVWSSVHSVLAVFSQVVWGLVLAYVMRPFAHLVERIMPKSMKPRARTRIGAFCSLVLLIIIIVVMLRTILPQSFSSATDLVNNFDIYLERVKGILKDYAAKISFIDIDVDTLIGNSDELLRRGIKWINDNLNLIVNTAGQFASQFASVLMNFVIAITLAVYALLDRANLKKALKRLEKALIGDEKMEKLNRVLSHGDYLMMNFLGSNLLDAFIIGLINFIFLGIVKAPYQLVLALLLGVTNFIPTFGPIIGGLIGSLIVLFTKSELLLGFIIFTVILQQIDGNVIKPLLFGDSTGLSPFWVLVAIIVGGEALGLTGMIIGVPLVALISSVLNSVLSKVNGEAVNESAPTPSRLRMLFQRLKKKKQGSPK